MQYLRLDDALIGGPVICLCLVALSGWTETDRDNSANGLKVDPNIESID